MDMQILSQKVKEIEMTEEMKDRILGQCGKKMEEEQMSTNRKTKIVRKPMVAVASMLACFCLVGVTALASTSKLKGYFKDIVGWNGAVIGSTYEDATDEITLNVTVAEDELIVAAKMVTPDMVPYMTFEHFGIHGYTIYNAEGDIIVKGNATDMMSIENGEALINLSVAELASGSYELVIDSFAGSSKADQPLVMHGKWEQSFVK